MHQPPRSTGNKSKEKDDPDHTREPREPLLDGDPAAPSTVPPGGPPPPIGGGPEGDSAPLTRHSSEYQASVTQPSPSALAQQNFRNRPRRGLGMAAANNLPMLPAGLLNQQPGQPEDWLVYYNNQSAQGLSSLFNNQQNIPAHSDLINQQYMAAHVSSTAPDEARSIYGDHASVHSAAATTGSGAGAGAAAGGAAGGAAGAGAAGAGGPHHMNLYNAHEYQNAISNYMDHRTPLALGGHLGGALGGALGGGSLVGPLGGHSGMVGQPGMGAPGMGGPASGGITTTTGTPYDLNNPPAFLPHNVGLTGLGPSRLNTDNAGIPQMAPMHMVVSMGTSGSAGEENVIDDGSDTDGRPLRSYHTTKLIDSENSAHDELYEKEMGKIPESFYRGQHNPTHPGALRTRRRSSRKQSNSFSSSYEDGLEESLTAAASQRQVDAAGTPWLVFEYPESQAKRQLYRIRCDIASLDLEIFDDKFRQQNCVYPKAMVPPEMYSGHRQGYETKCNEIGWKLAYMNPTLCGQRGLIQRAVDTYRNTNDLSTRSRRARRIARQQQKSGRLAKGSSG